MVFVGEFFDDLEILGLDVLLQHRWRSEAGEPIFLYGFYSPLVRNSLKEICFMPFSSLAVRSGVALITYFG